MYFQWLDFVDYFPGDFSQLLRFLWAFSLFRAKNVPKSTYLAVSNLLDVKYTREMDQSWCTPHDRTLWIISRVIFDSYWGFYDGSVFWGCLKQELAYQKLKSPLGHPITITKGHIWSIYTIYATTVPFPGSLVWFLPYLVSFWMDLVM